MQRSALSFVVFFAVITTVMGLIHWFIWARLVRAPELGPGVQRWGGVAIALLGVLTPVGVALARSMKRPASTWVAGAAYTWLGLAILLFIALSFGEVVRVGARLVAALTDTPFDPARRTFVARVVAGSAAAYAVGAGVLGAVAALGSVAVRKVDVHLARLPKQLSGFRVAQLSDLHIGPTLGKGWLADVVARVNATEPDVIVITGDLVDGDVASLRDDVAPLAGLRAKHGVYFVTGNHEYYSGVDAWLEELGRLGVRVLRNERVSIGDGDASFDLAGVDDWSAKRFGGDHGADLPRALAGRDPTRELVLLAHQPKQIDEAAAHGVGLQLSGHTHGGQIFPWNLFVRIDQPFVAGLDRRGDTQIYVSRGTGFWGPPLRVAAPSEISLLELIAPA
ncbi:MAG TPA: metallophosphoesterase [Byssovorax sp.]